MAAQSGLSWSRSPARLNLVNLYVVYLLRNKLICRASHQLTSKAIRTAAILRSPSCIRLKMKNAIKQMVSTHKDGRTVRGYVVLKNASAIH